MVATLDLEKVTTGRDGRLYVSVPDSAGVLVTTFLAQVNNWTAQFEIIDTDYQPAYEYGVGKVDTGGRFTLSITEAVVSDDPFLFTVIRSLRPPSASGRRPRLPRFDFTGIMDSADDDGQRGKYSMAKCKPTGSFDFFKIAPGAPNDRVWNFVSQLVPNITQKLLASAD